MSAIANTKKPRKKSQAELLHPFKCFNPCCWKRIRFLFHPRIHISIEIFFCFETDCALWVQGCLWQQQTQMLVTAIPKRTNPFPCSDLMRSFVQHLQLHSSGTEVGAAHEGVLWPRRGCCSPWRDAVDHKGMLLLVKGCCLLLAASCHGYKVRCFGGKKEKMNSGRPASLQPALGATLMHCVDRTRVGEALTSQKATAHARASSLVVRCKFRRGKNY